jgi:ribosomal protein L31E
MKLPKPPPQYTLTRSYKDYTTEKGSPPPLHQDRKNDSIFSNSNVNSKLDKFNNVLLTTLAVHAPVKITKIQNRSCPFITTDIKNQMSHRDQLHRRYKRTRDIDDWRAFKNAQRSVKSTLKAAEKQHVRTEVNLHKDNSRSLWKAINRCIPSKDKIILTYHKNTLEVANDFNQFFQSVGKSCRNS